MASCKVPDALNEKWRQPRLIDQVGEIIGGVALSTAVGGTGSKTMVDALAFERSGLVKTHIAPGVDTELLWSPELASDDLSLSIGYSAARTASELRAALSAADQPLQPSYYGAYPQGQVR